MVEPKRVELNLEQFNALLDRVEKNTLTVEDLPLISDIMRSMAWLSQTLEDANITMHRLKKIFGFQTERTSALEGLINKEDKKSSEISTNSDESKKDNNSEGIKEVNPNDINAINDSEEDQIPAPDTNQKKKRKSNRFSAKDYKDAVVTKIAHHSLKVGCRCPLCKSGNLRLTEPGTVLRILGQPWLQAHIYELERFRCNTCGKTFTAKLPIDVATAPKYDKAAKAIVSILKYRGGFPFYRQESLQTMLETPISDTVLWEMTRDVAMCLEPVFETLIKEASKGDCLHNDDTKARVLDLIRENKSRTNKDRTGIFTSAILSKLSNREIALFFTGRQHAGENLNDVLGNRPKEMCTPTQMCDASSNNTPKDHQTDEANCIAHLRRKFYEIAEIWPTYVLPIIVYLNTLFSNERKAKAQGLDEIGIFKMHKEKSAPVMEQLKNYCKDLIDGKKTEPNSNLGKAINYMFNHWEGFTLFLRKPGVPLDNNADERLMKRAVLNRKNGLFFKTEFGAYVGDILLSCIETCQLNEANPYHYLITVQTYKDEIKENPLAWLPWNYEETISRLNQLEQEISPEMIVSSLSPV